MLAMEFAHKIPKISTKPTIIIGVDVFHGFTGHADSPSISVVFIFYMLSRFLTGIDRRLNLIYVVMW